MSDGLAHPMSHPVLLVEDDIGTRDWLANLLSQDAATPTTVSVGNATDALHWLDQHEPSVVLIDLGLPDRPGTDVIRFAARRWPACDILVTTMFGDESHVVEALQAGANGYLLKDSSLESIREHLAYLRLGGSPMTPRIARLLMRRHRSDRLPGPDTGSMPLDPLGPPTGTGGGSGASAEAIDRFDDNDLSQRELDVLTGIGKGFSYAEVAQLLGLSTNTVRTYIKRIYEKLAVNSRTEAVYEFNQRQARRGKPPLA